MRKEIFVGQLPVVEYNFYDHKGMARTVTDATCIVNTEEHAVTQTDAGELEAILPYEDYADLEQEIKVRWEFTYAGHDYVKEDIVAIVTPLAEWDEFEKTFADNGLGYSEFRKVEQLVREIITAHCNQTFGKYVGTLPAEGNGSDGLVLTRRLISASDISWFNSAQNVVNVNDPNQWVPDHQFGDPNYTTYAFHWEIAADGWILRRNSLYRNKDVTRPELHTFKRNTVYQVTGVYGWDAVPAAVLKAAALLIEDYVCPDANYRNKYLDSIKFDQHRLDYHERAWNGTGNVLADQLLREYRVLPSIGVI